MALIGRWFAKYVVLATMVSRFAEILVDEKGIIDLMFSSENENNKKKYKVLDKHVSEVGSSKKIRTTP